jgi:superoxide dismutase, Fe-Mn family
VKELHLNIQNDLTDIVLFELKKKIMKQIFATLLSLWAFSAMSQVSISSSPQTPTKAPVESKGGNGPFMLPDLPYDYKALEPAIDEQTMHLHHDKHQAAYVTNLNNAIADPKFKHYSGLTLDLLCMKVDPNDFVIRNNAGGIWNHTFFWNCMSPIASKPSEKLLKAINASFGSLENLQAAISKEAKDRFGSGWVWLCADEKGTLFVTSTANQDNPLMTKLGGRPGTPILAIDVWEHAYYLKYQNKRADYITAVWGILNWEFANTNFNNIGH